MSTNVIIEWQPMQLAKQARALQAPIKNSKLRATKLTHSVPFDGMYYINSHTIKDIACNNNSEKMYYFV